MPGPLGTTPATQSIAYEGEGGGAPTTALYVVGATDASLSAELLITGNTWITGDTTVAGQVKWNIVNSSIGTTQLENLSVTTGKIANDSVTFAKLQNLSGSTRFVGRFSTGAGDAEDLSGASATQSLSQFTSTAQGVVAGSGGGTTNFLRADGAWAAPPSGSGASLTRIAASSGAAGADFTWQNLTANSADITSNTTPSAVMTTTGVGAGTWKFRYTLVYQTAATTTGIGIAVNHTGTTGLFASDWRQTCTSSAASNGIGDGIGAAAGGVHEGHPERVKNTITAASVGVDVANANVLMIVEGIVVVTASGNLELMVRSEVSGSAVRIMADSVLELHKIE